MIHVARANSQAHVALILRRVSIEIEPKGSVASFAAASKTTRSKRPRRLRQRDDAGVYRLDARSRARADGRFFHTHCGRPVLLRSNRRDQCDLRCLRHGRPSADCVEHHGNPGLIWCRTKVIFGDPSRRRGESERSRLRNYRRAHHSQSRTDLWHSPSPAWCRRGAC